MSATGTFHYRKNGFVTELALTAENGATLLQALEQAQAWLLDHGAAAVDPFALPAANIIAANVRGQNVTPAAGQNGAAQPEHPEGWCGIHQTQMRWNEADGGKGWWSHKADDGTWCKGKAKKAA